MQNSGTETGSTSPPSLRERESIRDLGFIGIASLRRAHCFRGDKKHHYNGRTDRVNGCDMTTNDWAVFRPGWHQLASCTAAGRHQTICHCHYVRPKPQVRDVCNTRILGLDWFFCRWCNWRQKMLFSPWHYNFHTKDHGDTWWRAAGEAWLDKDQGNANKLNASPHMR